jgi:hypothetical protein
MKENIENLLNYYKRADAGTKIEGRSWYSEGSDFARGLSPHFEVGAGVIAALSAQNEWNNNKREAEIVFLAFQAGLPADTEKISDAFGLESRLTRDNVSIRKAYKIIEQKAIGDVLLGKRVGRFQKQGNFAANLMGLTEYRGAYPVTIDTWAIHAWLGNRSPVMSQCPVGQEQTSFNKFRGKVFQNSFGLYHKIADDYREAAAIVKEKPENFQAIVWLQVKKENPQYVKRIG